MRGLDDILAGLQALAQSLGIHVPPWLVGLFAALALAIALPSIVANFQTSRARNVLLESRVVEGEKRAEMEKASLELVWTNKHGLSVLVEEAHKLGRGPFSREVLARLREVTGPTAEVKRLARLTDPDPLPNTPHQLGLMVEKLLSAGLHDKANERLRRGLNRWPNDPWLSELQQTAQRTSESEAT